MIYNVDGERLPCSTASFFDFDWTVFCWRFTQESSSPPVTSTRTATRSADSHRTTQTITTSPETKARPQPITPARVETTPTDVSGTGVVSSQWAILVLSGFKVQTSLTYFQNCLLFSTHSIEGYYIYHECDNVPNGQKARLLSPPIASAATQICVDFRYYMYGMDPDNLLRVLTRRSSGGEEENWKKMGIVSPSWQRGSVTVSKAASEKITVSMPNLFQVFLEATNYNVTRQFFFKIS